MLQRDARASAGQGKNSLDLQFRSHAFEPVQNESVPVVGVSAPHHSSPSWHKVAQTRCLRVAEAVLDTYDARLPRLHAALSDATLSHPVMDYPSLLPSPALCKGWAVTSHFHLQPVFAGMSARPCCQGPEKSEVRIGRDMEVNAGLTLMGGLSRHLTLFQLTGTEAVASSCGMTQLFLPGTSTPRLSKADPTLVFRLSCRGQSWQLPALVAQRGCDQGAMSEVLHGSSAIFVRTSEGMISCLS